MSSRKQAIHKSLAAVSRASILEGLEDEPSLQHLAWHAATVLAPAPGLESGGNKWGESEEGTTQGDPLSAPYFNVSWHRDVRVLNATLSASGGMAKFGMDDGYAAGPAHVIFSALEKFARDVKSRCSLVWERTKTEVFTWDGVLPEQATPGLTRAGVTVDGVFEPGFLCHGVLLGHISMLSLCWTGRLRILPKVPRMLAMCLVKKGRHFGLP